MDPNHWNYNPGYGRLTSSGLPTSHSSINFPILDQATITSGLGLPTGLPTHGALGSRPLPTLPAVNYHGHPLHNSVSQFLDPINSIQAANYAGQSPYKPITSSASPFTLDPSNRAIADLNIGYSGSRYSVSTPTSSGLSNTSSKSTYFPSDKEQAGSFSAAAQAVSEANLKGWGLSNFVQFGDISPSFPTGVQSSQPAPPPAHSTGNSGRVSSLSRNPFPGDESFSTRSKSTDSSLSHPLPPPSPYHTSNVQRSRSTSSSHPPVVSTPSYSASPPEIEDLSSHSQNPIYGSYPNVTSAGYSAITSNNPIYSSQLHPDMNYDPVSPVTPVSHSPPPSNTDPFNTVSLQDIESMGATTHLEKSRSSRKDLLINEHAVNKLSKRMIKESSNLLHSISGRTDRLGSMSNLAMQHQQKSSSIHNGKSKPSPMQQSPISVGSPQAPLSSPSTTMSTATFTPTPTPVQAVPDSTTKPKSRKPRKKKSDSSNASNFIPGASQPSYTTPTPNATMNQQANRNFSAEMSQSYRNALQHPPQFNQPSSRSANDATLSPLQRQIPSNIVEQMQVSAMSQSIGEDMVPMHRMSNLSEDLISRHSSIADNPHTSIHSSPGGDTLTHISSHSGHAQVSPLVTSPQIPVNHMIEASILSQARPSQDTGQRSFREQGPMLGGVFAEGDLQANQNQFDMNGYSGHTFLEELNSQSAPNIENFPGEMMVERQNFHPSMLEMGSYGQGHYGMTPAGMEQVDMNNSMHLGTIDESTFTSLLDQEAARRYRAPEPKLTFAIPIEQDEELSNFSRPPPNLPPSNSFLSKPHKLSTTPQNAFNESFVNFVKGKKPETLSSVNSVPHKKPQLPKYFPEPRRRVVPKPPEPKEEESSKTSMSFSDNSDSDHKASDALDDLMSDSNSDSDVSAEYTVKKQNKSTKKIPPLVIKKKVIQTKGGKQKPSKAKKSRKSVDQDFSLVADQFVPVEVEVAEPRTLISRKAKEKALEKSAKKKKTSDDSSSEESEPEYVPRSKKIRTGSRVSADYDSDDDPAWMPFAVDLKDQVEDEGELKKKKNRTRQKSGGGGTGRQRNKSQPMARRKTVESSEDSHQEIPARSSESTNRKSDDKRIPPESPVVKQPAKSKPEAPHKSSRVPDSKNRCREENEEESFQVGRFLIEKKDLHNYETYPIWRIEQGGMIHKYEIFPEEGNIRHMSVSTYSSWMPIMKDQFIPIRVSVLMEKNNKSVVEVLDEYKPKPPTDGSLENKYEEDPLVDLFNVYLQIFLSQALEPSFLRAIKDSQEHFYLVPLDKVDKMIDRKLDEIDRKVKWKPYFKECLKCRPGLKERDRPNLKQSCQACENSSPPTIKSLHLLGQPYDRFLLQTLKNDTNDTSSVFMIGKTASQYVSHYHSLYHFKYMLYQRCLAKIRIIRESDPSISNEHILDQCLQNRAWVLKIFHDLKELLEKV